MVDSLQSFTTAAATEVTLTDEDVFLCTGSQTLHFTLLFHYSVSVLIFTVEADLDRVIDTFLQYLSWRQPIKLQEACLSVFRWLMDSDLVWFSLNELSSPVPYEPPHPHLLRVKLTGSDKPRNQFTDNILKFLQEEDATYSALYI
ncbi:TELO2-interacting protein 1 homolog [Carassius auratus]|uniref:TELO2-interacting protein 1 homolog n=1 Tax=Carassius auratus TaxID=7957 RepID=A0A6P6N544_CARAU|nr:TELO2-interacting protein 1 homolog [Carassius auratus]